ncbi:MAG: manganese efflux pump [Clostridia bacterium]|nr:manganese efflux pump [Clostridia bacterium]
MNLSFAFFINSILLGVGLAMDAFSVSLANGLSEPCMKKKKSLGVAGVFAAFQFLMPMIGWLIVATAQHIFGFLENVIPWIALALLLIIGGKMLREGIEHKDEYVCRPYLTIGALLVQGVATSIDALSVGFTIASYNVFESLLACGIIGAVTFLLCFCGILIGKKVGTALAGKASVFGGIILILIGLEIFITSWL